MKLQMLVGMAQLSIETNSNKWLFDGDKLNITQEYIERVISKYAVVNDRAFNSGNPIMDGMFKMFVYQLHT